MRIKFLCCDVFTRIACDLVAKSPHIVDLEFLPMLTHDEPKKLNKMIQEKINKSVNESGRKYDAVILGFGLCGNSTIGLSCPIPMVIPRAHDCCTIHMGCRENFLAVFGDILSARWSSTGFYEREHSVISSCCGTSNCCGKTEQFSSYKTSAEYMGYVKQYGEDNADYIWETMHPEMETNEAVYIKIDGFEYSGSFEDYEREIDKAGKKLKIAYGNTSFLKSLVDGKWEDERFLIVPPGKKISGVYDMYYVMEAVD